MIFSKLRGVHLEWIPLIECDLFERENVVVIVVENNKQALHIKSIFDKSWKDVNVAYLEPFDSKIYENTFHDNLVFAKRASVLNFISDVRNKTLLITTIESLNYLVPPTDYFGDNCVLEQNCNITINSVLKKLINFGYRRVEVVQEIGQFAVRGGIIDIFLVTMKNPVRIDFFGNIVETIREFDINSQISTKHIEKIIITKCSEIILNDSSAALFKRKFVFDNEKIKESVERYCFFPGIEWYLSCFHEKMASLLDCFKEDTKFIFDFEIEKLNKNLFDDANYRYKRLGESVFPVDRIFCNAVDDVKNKFEVLHINPFEQNEEIHAHVKKYNIKSESSLAELLEDSDLKIIFSVSSQGAFNILTNVLSNIETNIIDKFCDAVEGVVNIIVSPLQNGFLSEKLSVYTEKELFGEVLKVASRRKNTDVFKDFSKLTVGDYVVHESHGVAIFDGLVNISVSGIAHDFLNLLYKNNDRLYVPVENIRLISRYGGDSANVELDALRGSSWGKRKTNVRRKLLVIANNLLQIAAKRKMQKMEPMVIPNDEYDLFCKGFPYIETDDQMAAIDDVLDDLEGQTPMDRLVCGDVGFGKTEVALRAAFITAMNLKQVVLLAPTTVLVSQHYKTFLKRFEGFGINICQLSRFSTTKEIKNNIEKIATGEVNIIIATHAILSSKIKFFDLGLVIIDEEQHFGVKQKEFIRSIRGDIHFMTLSATPIPRTMQLAISGVKDLSIIATPPIDRLPVKTFISDFDKITIKDAIENELQRGGQVFFVSPRVEYLDEIYELVSKLFPHIKVEKASGKSSNLEEIIRDFCDIKIDVLVSTNIIDSGVDIPNANTIIIHRVDLFGLSQIYQLRGRVGRSKRQAYAYFMLPENKTLSKEAVKRLDVMKKLDKLGSGFTLASHDLDIRGAGNMLGEEQSGYIKDVGVELYQSMLQEAILMLKAGANADIEDALHPQVNLGVPVLIPDHYIEDENLRLSLYRRIGSIESENEIDSMEFELSDRFGRLPQEVLNLLTVIKIIIYCKRANIEKLDVGSFGLTISFFNNKCNNPTALIELLHSDTIKANRGTAKMRSDGKILITKTWKNVNSRTNDILEIAKKLSEVLGSVS